MALSDAQILLLVREGRLEAFDDLIARYRPRLVRFVSQTFADPALADDLVQETFTAVFAARDSFDPTFAFSTWIWTILLNICRRERRRRQTQLRTWAQAARHRPPEVEDPPAVLQRLEEAERLRELLEDLPAAQADALRLRFFGGLAFDEIAATMNSSVSGAKSRVRKGLTALATRLRSSDQNAGNESSPLAMDPESRA